MARAIYTMCVRPSHVHLVTSMLAMVCAACEPRTCQPTETLDPWISAGQTISSRELDLTRDEYPLVTARVKIIGGTPYFSEPPWAETNAFVHSTGRAGLLQNRFAAVVRLLSNLTKMAELPDTDFVLNLGDIPIVRLWDTWPVISFSSSPHHADILAPDPAINDHTLRWPLGVVTQSAEPRLPFSSRAARAFFVDDLVDIGSRLDVSTRHSTTARLRRMAARRPDLLATARAREDETAVQAKYVVIDRPWLSSRVLHLAMSGAVPLIATTVYRSYWCACEAEAGVHYLPIQPDLSDLEATISSLREREDHAAAIAARAAHWAASCAAPEAINAYWKDLLHRYSEILSFRPFSRANKSTGASAELDFLWQQASASDE